jgi:8-oxo-dGTP pyrophosphatase MutT (NUDIX family)
MLVNSGEIHSGRDNMFTVGAFAIIFDVQHRVLLCHRRDMDRWNLPGGGVMSGETPWQAVIREVQEEVGLVVTVDRLIGVYAYPPGNDVIFSFLCWISSELTSLEQGVCCSKQFAIRTQVTDYF